MIVLTTSFIHDINAPNSSINKNCEEEEYASKRWLREQGVGEIPAQTPMPNGPQSCKANDEVY